MSYDPRDGYPRVVPVLAYADVAAAIGWLSSAFGTREVLVDDVDEHFERAREAGAKIVAEPEDKPWGLRQYRAEDPGGHRWEFSEHLRDVRPEDWGATPV